MCIVSNVTANIYKGYNSSKGKFTLHHLTYRWPNQDITDVGSVTVVLQVRNGECSSVIKDANIKLFYVGLCALKQVKVALLNRIWTVVLLSVY